MIPRVGQNFRNREAGIQGRVPLLRTCIKKVCFEEGGRDPEFPLPCSESFLPNHTFRLRTHLSDQPDPG